MDKNVKISFDFDGTLTKTEIQDLARHLDKSGNSLFIVTSRLGNMERMRHGLKTNEDIFALAQELGIPPHKISFTNQAKKWMLLNESGVNIHIDDDLAEVENLNWHGIVKAFDANSATLNEDVFEYVELLKEF